MEKLPTLPRNAERALKAYDAEIRRGIRKLKRRWAKMDHVAVAKFVEELDAEAETLCRELYTADPKKLPRALVAIIPKGSRTPSSWTKQQLRFVAGETWRMRHQPQDL